MGDEVSPELRAAYERCWTGFLTTFLGWTPERVRAWIEAREEDLSGRDSRSLSYHRDALHYVIPMIARPAWCGALDTPAYYRLEGEITAAIQMTEAVRRGVPKPHPEERPDYDWEAAKHRVGPVLSQYDRNAERIVADIRAQQSGWLDALRRLVEHESPSRDKPALDALACILAGRLEAIGGRVEVVANPDGGDHLIARFDGGHGGAEERPTLVVGHFDTVWPAGTLASMPFRVEGDRAFGPGVYDMKASLVQVEFALRAIRAAGLTPGRPVEVLLTSDEEIGSPTSRPLIEERARAASHVLVIEPPLANGALKTARKGVGAYRVTVEGRAAHAGVEPEKGISAIDELARITLALHALTDLAAGASVNVGVVAGGTTANVVAASASARVDVRAVTVAQAEALDAAIRALRPHHPDARLTITGGINRPPMERTPGGVGLFERARLVGQALGLDLGEGSTGGGSDGNFTAALGVPTLDGLGIEGAGAHATHEQVDLASFPARAALLAGLLLEPGPDRSDS